VVAHVARAPQAPHGAPVHDPEPTLRDPLVAVAAAISVIVSSPTMLISTTPTPTTAISTAADPLSAPDSSVFLTDAHRPNPTPAAAFESPIRTLPRPPFRDPPLHQPVPDR
jgi:hypothetical protein